MTELCRLSEIEDGEARGLDVDGQRYLVVRQQQNLFIYRNQCPHLGIPLDWQPNQFWDADGEFLRCATHGALFLPDTGECISGPCAGSFLSSVRFTQRGDRVYLALPAD